MIKNKYLLVIIAVLIWGYSMIWSFNHINPWITFGAVALTVLIINNFTKTKNKQS